MFPFSGFFSNKLVLSPMANYTDSPFRRIAKWHNCKLVYTELISSIAVLKNLGERLYKFYEDEKPIIAQIFGSIAEIMRDASIILIFGLIDVRISKTTNPDSFGITISRTIKSILSFCCL